MGGIAPRSYCPGEDSHSSPGRSGSVTRYETINFIARSSRPGPTLAAADGTEIPRRVSFPSQFFGLLSVIPRMEAGFECFEWVLPRFPSRAVIAGHAGCSPYMIRCDPNVAPRTLSLLPFFLVGSGSVTEGPASVPLAGACK